MNKIIIIACVVLLAGCGKTPDEVQRGLPAALSDCKYIPVDAGNRTLHVIRCPNSSTSTLWSEGKGGDHMAVTIDHVAAKQAAREIALSKLTSAEREVLGLK